MQIRKIHTLLISGLAGFKLGKSTFTASGFCKRLAVLVGASLTYINTNKGRQKYNISIISLKEKNLSIMYKIE